MCVGTWGQWATCTALKAVVWPCRGMCGYVVTCGTKEYIGVRVVV